MHGICHQGRTMSPNWMRCWMNFVSAHWRARRSWPFTHAPARMLAPVLPLVLLPHIGTAAQARSRPASGALVLDQVTVIDVEHGGRLRPGQTIVVVGDRIQAVGDSSRVRVPAGARLVNARGSYAIPGLWDMHVHPFGLFDTFYPLFLANGVTGVREMSTPFLDSTLRWRRAIAGGPRSAHGW